MLTALDAGAEDVQSSGDQWEVTGAAGDLRTIKEALEASGLAVESAEVTQLPSTSVPVGESHAKQVLRLVDALEDLDDVQEVFANFDISDEVLASLAG